eukprot:scaffold620_cov177-Ochromonas_danica.AAC.10
MEVVQQQVGLPLAHSVTPSLTSHHIALDRFRASPSHPSTTICPHHRSTDSLKKDGYCTYQ